MSALVKRLIYFKYLISLSTVITFGTSSLYAQINVSIQNSASQLAVGKKDYINITIAEPDADTDLPNDDEMLFSITPPIGFNISFACISDSINLSSPSNIQSSSISSEIVNNTLNITVRVSAVNATDNMVLLNVGLRPVPYYRGIYGNSITLTCDNSSVVFDNGDDDVTNTNSLDISYAPNIGSNATISLKDDADQDVLNTVLDYGKSYSAEISVWENYNCGFSDEDSDHDKSPTTPRNAVQCIESVNPLHTNA